MQHHAATEAGTTNYRNRFPDLAVAGHFRTSHGLQISSIGLGTYLGHHDERTDDAYRTAVTRAVEMGCNVIDTAANYRFQRSERAVGAALKSLFDSGEFRREEIVVTTKGGYLPFDGQPPRHRGEITAYIEDTFIKPGICAHEDFVQGSHCMHPRYLRHQFEQSLANLQLASIDVYYLHNPESQLAAVGREEFYTRLRLAFEYLESEAAAGRIACYGTATWNGYRASEDSPEFLSLERVAATAAEAAGGEHHFRVVQLPYNLTMTEALTEANQPIGDERMSLLKAAGELGVTVMGSASILQARLASNLQPAIADYFAGMHTDAQRAIQFARSAPGMATALVGMGRVEHVEENLAVAAVPPVTIENYLQLFSR